MSVLTIRLTAAAQMRLPSSVHLQVSSISVVYQCPRLQHPRAYEYAHSPSMPELNLYAPLRGPEDAIRTHPSL
jgi:hypothetical protein